MRLTLGVGKEGGVELKKAARVGRSSPSCARSAAHDESPAERKRRRDLLKLLGERKSIFPSKSTPRPLPASRKHSTSFNERAYERQDTVAYSPV